jgi:UDP-GlcNAc:undecaprenyl-phosphate GlcNAc-1-phosphate transferase
MLFLPLGKPLLLVLAGSVVAVVVGILDDKYDLSPYLRFLSNFLVASLPVVGGISVLFITNPMGGGVISFTHVILPFGLFGKQSAFIFTDMLSILWIAWTMNMLNWSTGVNGQMPGIAAITAVTIGILSLRFSPLDVGNVTTAKLSFIVAASALAFLPFNFPEARIFTGYSGTVIGFMLAVLSILSGAKVATALLVMSVPTIDAIVTIVRRISKGRSPFRGDRGHLHHLLIKRGFKVWQIALFYWIFSAVLGITSLMFSSQQKFFTIIVLGIIIGGGLLSLSLFSREEATPQE